MQVINRIILKITLQIFLSNSDIQVDLKKNNIKMCKEDWKIDIVDTGKNNDRWKT